MLAIVARKGGVGVERGMRRTVPVVMEVKQLVVPLRYYSQRIFEEGYDDQKAANGWEVSGV